MKLVGITQEQVDAKELKAKGDSVLAKRQQWYHDSGDPMYFQEIRGEGASVKGNTKSWKQAVADMKAANPYPEGYTP